MKIIFTKEDFESHAEMTQMLVDFGVLDVVAEEFGVNAELLTKIHKAKQIVTWENNVEIIKATADSISAMSAVCCRVAVSVAEDGQSVVFDVKNPSLETSDERLKFVRTARAIIRGIGKLHRLALTAKKLLWALPEVKTLCEALDSHVRATVSKISEINSEK